MLLSPVGGQEQIQGPSPFSRERGEARGAVKASQAEIQEMSPSATNFLCDLGHDIFISKVKCFK